MLESLTKHKVSRIILTVVIFSLFALLFLPFFAPILIAALFAFALEPIVSNFSKRPSRRKLPAVVLLFGFFILTAGPIVLVFFRFSAKMRELSKSGLDNSPIYQGLEKIYAWGMDQWSVWGHRVGIISDTSDGSEQSSIISSAASFTLTQLGNIASQTPQFLIGLFVFTLALYYFLTESKKIKSAIWSLDLLPAGEMQRITHELQKGSYITLVSSAITGAIQATFIAVAALIFGHNEFLIIFVITFFVSFIPVIGAAPVSVFLALISIVSGDVSAAIGLGIAAAIAGSIDNLVRPYLATSDEEDISPLISLLAIIGAVILFGFTGVLLGPVLTRLAFKILPILFENKDKA
jgi:predicted PurR-regulated permease PerM